MTLAEDTAVLSNNFLRARAEGRHEFRIPAGTHVVAGDLLKTRLCHISNNDHGLKPILFDIDNAEDFVLDGQGAVLQCYGGVLPIRVGSSRRVAIRNLTIDWVRPFFTQAVITDASQGWIEFEYDPVRYPLAVDGQRLIARDDRGWKTDRLWNLLPFDPRRGEVAGNREHWHLSTFHRASPCGDGRIRLHADFTAPFAPGVPIVLMHGDRVSGGIWVEQSEKVTIEDITIHHAPGMGVIAQTSRDLEIHRLRVTPSGDRLFSTWVDAIHCTDCDGATRITGCDLRGQFDDAVNLHARFYLVTDHPMPNTVRVRTVHPQHAGPCAAIPGAGWAFYRRSDLARVHETTVTKVQQIDPEHADITVRNPVPAQIGELVCSRYDPDSTVVISGCRFGANRGRGILINLEHHTVVENNHFHVSGRAIESIPDTNYWWEGSPVQDLIIRNNTFEDCCFGPCGEDLFYLGPELPDGSDPRASPLRSTEQDSTPCRTPVLAGICIEHNEIIRHRGRILHAHGVDGLRFMGNRIQDSQRYPMDNIPEPFQLGPGIQRAEIQPEASTIKSLP